MRKFSVLWRQWALTLTLLVTLSGCSEFPNYVKSFIPRSRSGLSCSFFRDSLWQEFGFGQDSQDEVIHTVTSLWTSLNESLIDTYELYGDGLDWGVEWWAYSDGARSRYYAVGGKERKLVYIRVELKPAVTLAQILDCLGPPELYGTDTPPDFVNGLGLGLWYVERGFMVSGLTHGARVRPTEFNLAFPMDTFHAAPRGDLDMMVTHLGSPSLHMAFLCTLRPWPGAIEEIVIEAFNGNARC